MGGEKKERAGKPWFNSRLLTLLGTQGKREKSHKRRKGEGVIFGSQRKS